MGPWGGAPKGKANGNYKTRRFTAEVIRASRYVQALGPLVKQLHEAEP